MGSLKRLLTLALFGALAWVLPWTVSQAEEIVARGAFYDGPHAPQHRVSGEAVITKGDDGKYRLDIADFVSDAGPDLYFIVSTAKEPTKDTHIRQSEWVIVAPRKSLTGDQSYDLPAEYDPDVHQSIGLWCRQYSVMFGAAALDSVEEQQ